MPETTKNLIIIVIKVLNITSISKIFEKASISIVPPVLSIVNIYTAISYIAVTIITMIVTINLLSLEKFLLNISPSIPITPNASAEIPTFFPRIISIYNPKAIPNTNPKFSFHE